MCYHYRVDPKLSKCVCAIRRIPCECTDYVDQLDKYWLPNCDPSSQSRYDYVENCYYNKIIEHYNVWIIMEVLNNKTPHVALVNISAFVLAGMSTNNEELVEMNVYGTIYTNDEADFFRLFTLHLSCTHSNMT